MCGIAGIVSTRGTAREFVPPVQSMTDAQRHRGPDGGGVEVVCGGTPAAAVFGHRRLAIIDLSEAGREPMRDAETGNWLTFNGEIYNFRELRGELEKLGHVFDTRTDAEVILKAYACWGVACVGRLRGIFAFAIWGGDAGEQKLFIARDQLGVKPLYYPQDEEGLLFASEVRALLASGLVGRKLDLEGLHSFLAYGSVQEPLTLVRGVRSLPPGHFLVWQGGRATVERYWRLPEAGEIRTGVNGHLFEETRERLEDAVRSQLVADVPLGAFLSGGIDSTAIAALARGAGSRPLKTFSVVFDEAAYDEREYSRLAARHLGTEHTELRLTGEGFLKTLPQAVAAFDQPSQDGLNTYAISKVIREAGPVVALSGVGGDELFGGYDGYRKALLAERWAGRASRLPRPARALAGGLVGGFATRESLRKFSELLRDTRNHYFLTRQVFSASQISELLPAEVYRPGSEWYGVTRPRLAAETADFDPVNRASALELQTYMLSTLLRDTDQMSMAHALEVRVPLLDHRLVEYLFTLPGSVKLEEGQPKPLLTRALGDELPGGCVHRPKRGFELPFAVWLRQSLQTRVREKLLHPPAGPRELFRAGGVTGVWEKFEQGRLAWSRVWGLFVLFEWLEAHRVSA